MSRNIVDILEERSLQEPVYRSRGEAISGSAFETRWRRRRVAWVRLWVI